MNFPAGHIHRSAARFLAVLAAPLLLLIGCATAADDAGAQKIIAIGDLHGDYGAYESLMREAGLINERGKWSGGDTIFVQTGDVPDRGPDSLKIIKHLRKLQRQARRKGGKVIALVGNHEAMNMTGDLRYVHPGEYEAFTTYDSKKLRARVYGLNRKNIETAYLEQDATLSSRAIKSKWESKTPLGMIEHQQAWSPDGGIGRWIAGNPAVAIAGDSLFVHGGISPAYISISVEEINARVAEALAARAVDPASIINDQMGPLWYRGLVQEPAPPADNPDAGAGIDPAPEMNWAEGIDAALAAFGVSRIIVGHTPSRDGVNALHDGKVIQIDTGIAAHYGGTRSFLRIENGVLYAHDNGVVQLLTDRGGE